MGRYIAGRILWMFPTMILMSMALFILIHSTPGSPFQIEKANQAYIDNLNKQYGLDKPLPQQYLTWIGNVSHGEFGYSTFYKSRKVQEILREQFPLSLRIGAIATLVSFVGGIALGMIAAVNQNGPLDYLSTLISIFGASVPNFVAAFLLLFLFVVVLPGTFHLSFGFTTTWTGKTKDYVLPVAALAFLPLATIASYTRASMLDAIRSDYVRTARAKGASERRVIGRHVLKNALMPAITLVGPIFAGIGTGTFVVEQTFDIPGMGKNFVTSLGNRDYPMVMAVFLLYGVFLTIMALAVDLIYSAVDPRVRFVGRR
jgi:ABC-type dipeptide/oligopeptide/nickel transport system permease component